MDIDTSRKTVSITRACELCGVSRRTIYNWIDQNKIEIVRTASGSPRIFQDTLFRNPRDKMRSRDNLSKVINVSIQK